MEQLIACRICLATDVKLFEMCKYGLKTVYESLTGLDVSRSSYSNHVCSYCGTLLNKFKKFQTQCKASERVMQDLLENGLKIDLTSLNSCLHPYTTNIIHNFGVESISIKDENDENNEYDELNTDHDNLNAEYDELNTDRGNLNTKYEELKRNHYHDLNTENTEMNTNLNAENYYYSDVDKQSLEFTNDLEIKPLRAEKKDDIKSDSDEEPLANIVKRKRKKTKESIRALTTKANYNRNEIKSEVSDNLVSNNDSFSYTYPRNDNNYPRNDDNYSRNDDKYPRNDNTYPKGDEYFANNDDTQEKRKVKTKRKKSKKILKIIIAQAICNINRNDSESNADLATSDISSPKIDNNQSKSDDIYQRNDSTNNNDNTDLENDDKPIKIPEDLVPDHKCIVLSIEEQKKEVLERKLSANYLNSFYKCDQCYRGFLKEVTYENHMMKHNPRSGANVCDVCSTFWPDKKMLRAHIVNSHERRYTCKTCGEVTKSAFKARDHHKWHMGVTFACEHCDKLFSKQTSYLSHKRTKHSSNVCDICNMTFIGEKGLRMHKKKSHNKGRATRHKCSECKLVFVSTEALTRHSDLTSGICQNLFVCTECGDHFDKDTLLKEHKNTHQSSDLRKCPQCPQSFSAARALTSHIQSAHGKVPSRWVCEICGLKCNTRTKLKNHQRVHTGEKPYACKYCDKRFSVAQRMNIHVRMHTGERPYQCTHCPKAFPNKCALNRHDRIHTGVKPYECPLCGKRFSQSNSLKQHYSGVHNKQYLFSRGRAKPKSVE